MFIKFHIKKEFIFIIYFIPISLLFIVLKKFLHNMIILINILECSQIFLYIVAIYNKYQINKSSDSIINERKKAKQFEVFLLLIFLITLSLIHLYLYQFIEQFLYLDYQEFLYSSMIILIDGIFFKTQIYSHQIFSFILLIFGMIILFIKRDINCFSFIILILDSYCYSFYNLLIYYINKIYFIDVFALGSLIGFSNLLQILIYFKDLGLIVEFYKIFILLFIIDFIFFFFFYKLVSKFGPIIALYSYNISCFIFLGIFLDLEIILMLISYFAGLIYLEIIEINICGLNKNIKINISERAKIDINIMLQDFGSSTENSIII